VTIGAVNTITLDAAREQAGAMIQDLRSGIDPKRKVSNPTLKEALDGYLAATKDLAQSSIRAYRGVERDLQSWLDKPLRSITPDIVENRHRELAAEIRGRGQYDGEFTANAALRIFRILYNHALERTPDLPANPVTRLKRQWFAEPRRQGKVKAEEMPKFYEAVMALKNPVQRDFILLLLHTGMRKTECATMKWEWVDFHERVIRLPASVTKTRKAFDLPMSDYVHSLLVARRALGNAGFVFPGSGKRGHVSDHGFGAVAKACGVEVTAHDLRRTFLSLADSLGLSVYVVKALANHAVNKDITGGYVIVDQERLRKAEQQVCDELARLCGRVPVTAANLERLRG
jgi:integrase